MGTGAIGPLLKNQVHTQKSIPKKLKTQICIEKL